jgi:branched-chain amino acid transport system ATP-binding protein
MPLLEARGMTASYGQFQALFGIDLALDEGETVAIIGSNGAGKTTFLRGLTGVLGCAKDAVLYRGEPIGGLAPERIVRMGIAMVPEGRRLFSSLSTEENLKIGGLSRRKGPWSLAQVYKLFPMLEEKRNLPATQLSGGQQQMVAIARALMSNPQVLLCDELSLGLAPTVIKDIYATLPRITAQGCSVIVVEQDISQAMAASSSVYCFREGRVSLSGPCKSLTRDAISAAYFGV